MKINYNGTTVTFKTESKELFEVEKSGAKSNTVRILDTDEWRQLKKPDSNGPKMIITQYQQEIFLRHLTNVYLGGVILGKCIVIFSWEPKGRYGHSQRIKEHPSGLRDHNMSLDELSPILLPRSLIHDLGTHRRNRSHAEFIFDLLDEHIIFQATEQRAHRLGQEEAMPAAETSPPSEESFAAITVSKGTLGLLQSIAHGRTMNMVVNELYETCMYQREGKTENEG